LGGALRALAPLSPRLLAELAKAAEVLERRASFDRPLYGAAVRALAESGDASVTEILARALVSEEAGGLSSLAASAFVKDGALEVPLARAATNRHPVLAFAAETARLARGDSKASLIASLAPKIKEAHRIALCSELFVSLLWRPPLPVSVGPALAVLRDAERHLGRWLLLGEVAARAGDAKPLEEARGRAERGPQSARAAWALVAWALDPQARFPSARPTVELIARLSDRPSADRDATFLFRMASARAPTARPMLEGIAKGSSLGDEASVRAALHLCRDYGQARHLKALTEAGKSPKKDALRGLAAAALFDCGQCEAAIEVAGELEASRQLSAIGWACLIRAAAAPGRRDGLLVSEPNFRRIQQGFSK
jgi:hypothetical protein